MRIDIREEIKTNILKYGQHLVCVGKTEEEPDNFLPFVYTIGNHEAGFPELLLIFACDDICVRIINILGKMQRDRGTGFQHGEIIDYSAKLPARIIDACQKGRSEYAVHAGVYYDTEIFELRQVLLPDKNGRYPGEIGCLPPYSEQPLLTSTH